MIQKIQFRLFNRILDCTSTGLVKHSAIIVHILNNVYRSEAISLSRFCVRIICVQDGDVTHLNFTVRTGPKFGKYVVTLTFKLYSKYSIICSIHS